MLNLASPMNGNISAETYKKEELLIRRLESFGKVLVAFSGGVDSAYLLAVARGTLGEECRAVFVRGDMVSSREEKEALALGERYACTLAVLDSDVLAIEEFRANVPERCYYCKKKIFETILAYNWKTGRAAVVEGTNASDATDYRPGRKALQELGIASPLWEVGLTKAEIRQLSKDRLLPTWDKPAMACLATRIPFGDPISAELLQRIDRAEDILWRKGYVECRVRVHRDVALIEIPEADFPAFLGQQAEITEAMLKLGFRFITLDLKGLRSGSLNPVEREGKV